MQTRPTDAQNYASRMIRTLHMALVAAMNAGNRQEALAISKEIEKWEAVRKCDLTALRR